MQKRSTDKNRIDRKPQTHRVQNGSGMQAEKRERSAHANIGIDLRGADIDKSREMVEPNSGDREGKTRRNNTRPDGILWDGKTHVMGNLGRHQKQVKTNICRKQRLNSERAGEGKWKRRRWCGGGRSAPPDKGVTELPDRGGRGFGGKAAKLKYCRARGTRQT